MSNHLHSVPSSVLSSEISCFGDVEETDEEGLGAGARDENCDLNKPVSRKKRVKRSNRVKYWTLPTMSTGTFDPSLLTERQQLQYLSQKSKGRGEEDSLEFSPLRLDRIKLEELKSLRADTLTISSNTSNSNNGLLLNTCSSPLLKSQSQQPQHQHQERQQSLSSPIARKSRQKPKFLPSRLSASFLSTASEGSEVEESSNENKTSAVVISLSAAPRTPSKPALRSVAAVIGLKDSMSHDDASDKTRFTRPGIPNLPTPTQTFLDYFADVRRRHLEAFLDSMAVRKGIVLDKKREDGLKLKRKELEIQVQIK